MINLDGACQAFAGGGSLCGSNCEAMVLKRLCLVIVLL